MALVVYDSNAEAEPEESSSLFDDGVHTPIGLSNQGATCYLNGLLQTLYMTPEFRWAMLSWNYDREQHGSEEFCIPLQLQKLFGFLMLSKQKAIDTVGITKSFGWEGSEVFQQQDVQELTRVLFDALEESFKGTPSEKVLDKMYAGQMIDYLRCIDVDYESERSDKFLDLSVAILPFGQEKACGTLSECIETFLQPEILDGDNKYYAEDFKRKTTALKGLKICHLPKIMSVHLKRFIPDFTSWNVSMKKVNDTVTFPMVLDMNKYIAKKKEERRSSLGGAGRRRSMSSHSDTSSIGGERGDSCIHRSVSIESKEGSADNAQKRASSTSSRSSSSSSSSSRSSSGGGSSSSGGIQEAPPPEDPLDGDAGLDESCEGEGLFEREFGEGEEFELFLQEEIRKLKMAQQGQAQAQAEKKQEEGFEEMTLGDNVDEATGEAKQGSTATATTTTTTKEGHSGSDLEATEEDEEKDKEREKEALLREQLSYTNKDIPSLLSTRGPWVYELYAVLIHSGSANGGHYYAYIKDLDSQQWWNFNDSNVSRMSEEEVKLAWGGTGDGVGAGLGTYVGNKGKGFGGRANYHSTANAYMLMYRQAAGKGEAVVPLPTAEAVPEYLREMVAEMEEKVEAKKKEEQERYNKMMLNVHYTSPEGVEGEKTVLCRKTMTLREVLDLLRREIFPAMASEDVLPLARLRLRDYSLHQRIATTAHEVEERGDRVMATLNFYDGKHVALETRAEEEEWEPWYDNGTTITCHVYNSRIDTLTVRYMRVPKEATVNDLRSRLKLKRAEVDSAAGEGDVAGGSSPKIRLMRVTEVYNASASNFQTHVGEVFTQGSQRLKEDLHVYESTKVFCDDEPDTGCALGSGKQEPQPTANNCRAIACYVEAKNRISVNINCPPSASHTVNLEISLTWTIEKLRSIVVDKLNDVRGANEDPFTMQNTRLFKASAHGVELKLGEEAPLSKLHVYDRMNIWVSRGMPATLGQYQLNLLLFEPKAWQKTIRWGVQEVPEAADKDYSNESREAADTEVDSGKAFQEGAEATETAEDTKLSSIYDRNAALFEAGAAIETPATVAKGEDAAETTPASGREERAELAADVITVSFNDANHESREPSFGVHIDKNDSGSEGESTAYTEALGPSTSTFGDESVDFITDASDFVTTGISVPARNATMVEELRDLVYARLREAGYFDAETQEAVAGKGEAGTSSSDAVNLSANVLALEDTLHAQTRAKHRYPHVTGPKYIRIRSSGSGYSPPGSILRDGTSLLEAKFSLFTDKALVVQVLTQPETLPVQQAGDAIVLMQRWYRSTWTLGERIEVHLEGRKTIKDLSKGIGALLGISRPENIRILRLSKLGNNVHLHQLDKDQPSCAGYDFVGWSDPRLEGDVELKRARKFPVGDGDLLLVQDTKEPLRKLNDVEIASVKAVLSAGDGNLPDYTADWGDLAGGVPPAKHANYATSKAPTGPEGYTPWCPSTGASGGPSKEAAGTTGTRPYTTAGGGTRRAGSGVKIKKLSDRIKEDKEKEQREEDTRVELADGSMSGSVVLFDDL